MYADHRRGVVIPFPQRARMPPARQHRARTLAPPHAARHHAAWQAVTGRAGAWRSAGSDALAFAGTIAIAAAQAALLLRAFGVRGF